MSTQSRSRNPKRPTTCKRRVFPGPDMGLIPTKTLRLFRPDKGDAHNYQPHGKFSGVTRVVRAVKKAKARESKLV